MKRGRGIFCAMLVAVLVPVMAVPAYAVEGGTTILNLESVLESLFIPDADFMTDMVEDIQSRFDKKFAGVASAVSYLRERFSDLHGYYDSEGIFKVTFPPGSFLYGISMNLLTPGKAVLAWVRFCITGFIVLFTVIVCYRKVIGLVKG